MDYREVVRSPGTIDYRYEGYYRIDLDSNDIEEMRYNIDTENHREFMPTLINKIKCNGDILRRYCGWLRIFLDKEGEEEPISFLMRKFNLYINAVHNGHKLYELGYKDPKFFIDVCLTGFGVTYRELFRSSSLFGIRLGYRQVSIYARVMYANRDRPNEWRHAIGILVLTFAESGRFVWIDEDITLAIEEERVINVEREGPYSYIDKLRFYWGDASEVARSLPYQWEEDLEWDQPNTKTIEGLRTFLISVRYANAGLHIQTLSKRPPPGYNRRGPGGGGGGDGGGDGGDGDDNGRGNGGPKTRHSGGGDGGSKPRFKRRFGSESSDSNTGTSNKYKRYKSGVSDCEGAGEMFQATTLINDAEICLDGNLEVPTSWPTSQKMIRFCCLSDFEDESEVSMNPGDARSYVESSKVSESLLLMKFYSLSRGVVSHLHSGKEVDLSNPVFDYWKLRGLAQMRKVDDSMARAMRVTSSPQEWRERGKKFFYENNFVMASLCFERAGDTMWDRASADQMRRTNHEAFLGYVRDAAEIFESVGKFESAASCYCDLGEYERAGLVETDPEGALTGFAEVVQMEPEKAEWGFKALKQTVKLYYRLGRYKEMTDAYREMLTYIKSAMTRNYSENFGLLQDFYQTTLKALEEAKNERLWFKTNLKLCKIYFDMGEYGKMNKILKELHKSCQKADGTDDQKKGTQLLEVYAIEIQMYTKTKNNKKLKQLYQKALTIKSAIPHPRIMGIIHECGGKMHMAERQWDEAATDFFEAFKNYDEAGNQRRIQCLKYLVLANMLMLSEVNPFDGQEAKPYKNDLEILAMTNLIAAYQRNEILEFEKILKINRRTIMDDPFIRNYIEDLLKNIRTQVLLKLIKPYTRIRIPFISKELNVPEADVEQLLVSLILDNRVQGHIDQVNRQLECGDRSKGIKKYTAVEKWNTQLRSLYQSVSNRVG